MTVCNADVTNPQRRHDGFPNYQATVDKMVLGVKLEDSFRSNIEENVQKGYLQYIGENQNEKDYTSLRYWKVSDKAFKEASEILGYGLHQKCRPKFTKRDRDNRKKEFLAEVYAGMSS